MKSAKKKNPNFYDKMIQIKVFYSLVIPDGYSYFANCIRDLYQAQCAS